MSQSADESEKREEMRCSRLIEQGAPRSTPNPSPSPLRRRWPLPQWTPPPSRSLSPSAVGQQETAQAHTQARTELALSAVPQSCRKGWADDHRRAISQEMARPALRTPGSTTGTSEFTSTPGPLRPRRPYVGRPGRPPHGHKVSIMQQGEGAGERVIVVTGCGAATGTRKGSDEAHRATAPPLRP